MQFKGSFFITGKVLSSYNEWAIRRNFPSYKYLKDLAKVIDAASDHPIKAENRYKRLRGGIEPPIV